MDFDFFHPVGIYGKNPDFQIIILEAVTFLGNFAQLFGNPATQGNHFGFGFHIKELAEFIQCGGSVYPVGICTDFCDLFYDIVVLVPNFAYQFF